MSDIEKEVIDLHEDHATHETYLSDCSECYKENKLIQFAKGIIKSLQGVEYKELTIHDDLSGYSYR